MNARPDMRKSVLAAAGLFLCSVFSVPGCADAAVMNDYCIQPPFIAAPIPPLVMFEVGRDHKLYYEAYNDAADLDDDGKLDVDYKHSIDYYGYFDPYKCYTFSGGVNGGTNVNDQFNPVSLTTDKFCSSGGGQWSGNVLNWISMSRMDVLKKVLYGGHRKSDTSTEAVLERVYIPQDAHSWGKEMTGRLCASGGTYTISCMVDSDCESGYTCVDKSNQLIGIAPSDNGVTGPCDITVLPSKVNDKILHVRYRHDAALADDIQYANGANDIEKHANLMASYDPASTPDTGFFSYSKVNDFNDALFAASDHADYYNMIAVLEFNVANSGVNKKGTWQFVVDGNDAAEVEIFPSASNTGGTVVASYYGGASGANGHTMCGVVPNATASNLCAGMVSGTISLASGWYRMVVRHSEKTGNDGIKVWVKRTDDAGFNLVGTTTFGSGKMRTWDVGATNACTLKTGDFISSGMPSIIASASSGIAKRHLFCNTTLSDAGTPIMRLVKDSAKRLWDWASKERPVCGTTYADGSSVGTIYDYAVRVKVCDPSVDTSTNLQLERADFCKEYPAPGSGSWKPIGLLQQFGEGDGSKVCSKKMSKPCNSGADCSFATEGICIDRSAMYFGMMTTSYEKNLSGGVLRKNIGAILDESNANNGIFQTSENEQGNIIITFDRLKIVGFDYSNKAYQSTAGGTCGWITDGPLSEGECRDWGNPVAEMMYESLRYFGGKLNPTSAFTYSGTQDATLQLSKPAWGYKVGSNYYPPYSVYPSCAKPFILLLGDPTTSYDSDQIPGSSFGSVTEDTETPQLGLGTVTSGVSLLNSLTETIGNYEGINGNNWYIGENGTTRDFMCSPKGSSQFSLLRGMCPEEPTKMGSYYSAAIAYYGKTMFQAKTGKPDINTFAVALSSPFSDLKIKAGSGTVSLLPIGKSVSGSGVYGNCYQRMNLTYDSAARGLSIDPKSPADAAAYCPSNQIVDFYVDDIRYDSDKNITYAKFRINFEDVEQGADHDMDAIVSYEICTRTAWSNGWGTCVDEPNADQVEVKLFCDYAAGSIDQVMGFVISGTQADGVYLPIKDKDVPNSSDADTPATIAGMPTTWQRTFTLGSSSSVASSLKNPFWYAAKWGGFLDKNGNNRPDLRSEWANSCQESDVTKCNPDNYYLVVNPLKLRTQLKKALEDILARVASGTAASILNNSEGSGANLVQAVFYPRKAFDDNTEVEWIGEMQNLWYFLDPNLQKTSIREDTNQNNTLNLKDDYVAQFYFDSGQSKTLVKRFVDANGDGAADDPSTPFDTISPDDVNSLWKAGRMLWERNLTSSPRTLYTNFGLTGSGAPRSFDKSTGTGGFLALTGALTALQAADSTEAAKIVDYVSGIDQAGYRSRKVTILNCGLASCNREWKLGDIVSSTPKLVSNVKINSYNMTPPYGYNDGSYEAFTQTSTYKGRGMVFVGGNDGMLHAFKLGVLKELTSVFDKSMIVNAYGDTLPATATANLGKEQWAFIPKHTLPYLKYLGDPDYSHLYYIDRTSTIIDANINRPASCDSTLVPNSSDCTKDYSAWRTVLIGGMGFGGAAKTTGDSCSAPANCVKPPVSGTGYSSYFALDVTDPENPVYLWEFPNPSDTTHAAALGTLGFTTTGPAIVRISAKTKDAGGNDTTTPDHNKNGKWFAVFASGPTGPIDTTLHQFKGESDQQLRIFIVDLATGELLRTITTDAVGNALPANAFSGSLATSVIDADRSVTTAKGYYSDDAVYIGYVQKDTSVTPNTWTKGGVLRLLTKESRDPSQWDVSKLIDNIGPVTTSVTKLQDRKNHNLWVFFGTGRFFFKQDDTSTQQKLYGVKEPCYASAERLFQTQIAGGTYNKIDPNCTDPVVDTVLNPIVNQSGNSTTAPATTLLPAASGWYINLDAATSNDNAERVITDPIAAGNGAVFFTTFKPSADICKFGGDSLIWALRYDTGGVPPAAAMQGRALMQVSTGAFAEISLKDGFSNPSDLRYDGRRLANPISGVPPTAQGLSLLTNPRPIKKLLHIQEK